MGGREDMLGRDEGTTAHGHRCATDWNVKAGLERKLTLICGYSSDDRVML